jgi:hypothetical protein
MSDRIYSDYMRNAKLKRLKAAGWRVGTANDFLGLDKQKAVLVDVKRSLIDAVQKACQKRRRRTRHSA